MSPTSIADTSRSTYTTSTEGPAAQQAASERDDELADSFAELFSFSTELDAAIAGVLQTKEPLDQQDFNPVAYINHIFPNEQSLASIDMVLSKLRIKIRRLDREIKELVRAQTDAGSRGVAELQAAKKAIQDLFTKIKQIKEKAQQNEQMVQEITHDIKSLDFAKRHLTTSITALKRLQMLVTAVDQLKVMSARKQYKETVQLLQAVLQLISHFVTYKNVKQISDLSDSVHSLQAELRKQIYDDFEGSFNNQGVLTGHANTLNDACAVINILGKDAKKQLIDWYCNLQIKQYRSIFGDVSSELAALDSTARRYSWLKRLLKIYDEEHANIFPQGWRVSEVLCEMFCDVTMKDLKSVLAATQNLDVKLLLKILQQTIEFESGLTKRFSRQDVAATSAKSSENDVSQEQQQQQQQTTAKAFKSMSSCFEPYLSHYIESEDQILSEMMEGYKNQPPASEEDATIQVLASSTDLFYFYRETLVHCSTLSTRKPFLDLCKLFGKWLFSYANDILIGKLPKDEKRAATTEELQAIGLILNTADYCFNTTSQLEEKLKDKIDPEFKSQVSLEREREMFLNVLTTCIKVLVRGVETGHDAALANMIKIPWGALESVGDQSEYVTAMVSTLRSSIPVIRSTIAQNKYFRTFCDKFVESFGPRFLGNIQKCRPISEVGAEQMLLDTHAIKIALLDMPSMGSDSSGPTPATYTKIVNKGLGKVERLLKVVMTPPDPPEGLVETYIMLFADSSLANFLKVLDLKGLKKGEQQSLTEAFQHRLPAPPSGLQPSIPSNTTNASTTSIFFSAGNVNHNNNHNANSTANVTGTASNSGTSVPTSSTTSAPTTTKFNENLRKFVGGLGMKRGDASGAAAVGATGVGATAPGSGGNASTGNGIAGGAKRLF